MLWSLHLQFRVEGCDCHFAEKNMFRLCCTTWHLQNDPPKKVTIKKRPAKSGVRGVISYTAKDVPELINEKNLKRFAVNFGCGRFGSNKPEISTLQR